MKYPYKIILKGIRDAQGNPHEINLTSDEHRKIMESIEKGATQLVLRGQYIPLSSVAGIIEY